MPKQGFNKFSDELANDLWYKCQRFSLPYYT